MKMAGIRLRQLPSGAPWKRVALSPDKSITSTANANTVATTRTDVAWADTSVPFTSNSSSAAKGQQVVAQQADGPDQDALPADQYVLPFGEQNQPDRQANGDPDRPVEPR